MLVSILILTNLTFSQNNKYLGKEKDITLSELLLKADNTNFEDQIVKRIYSDEKNSYFALKNNTISSKYVKVRILEQSYQDKSLVNIGPEMDDGYMVFLVNNTLNKSDNEIINLFESWRQKAVREMNSMGEAEMKKWIDEHIKFYTK